MVIIQTKSGRLANRLHIFSWFIANSIEHGYALANPTFDEYCRYFPSTRENDFGDLPISVIAPLNLPYKVFFPVTSILKRSEEHTSELQSRGHLVCRHLLEKRKEP